jgi:hypothetical protein
MSYLKLYEKGSNGMENLLNVENEKNDFNGIADKFILLKSVPEYVPGLTEYRARLLCKQGQIRHLKAGNRYVVRLSWLIQDLEKMAELNLQKPEEAFEYDKLRKIKG